MQAEVATFTERGGSHAVNEDRIAVIETPDSWVLTVADGAGGRPNGAATAEAAIQWVRRVMDERSNVRGVRHWTKIISEMDRVMSKSASSGETTLVIAEVMQDRIYGASVGDSSGFLFSGLNGVDLTAAQRAKPGVGTGCCEPVAFKAQMGDGTLLLASDGLVKYRGMEAISTMIGRDLNQSAKGLVDQVRHEIYGLHDDVALILFRLRESNASALGVDSP